MGICWHHQLSSCHGFGYVRLVFVFHKEWPHSTVKKLYKVHICVSSTKFKCKEGNTCLPGFKENPHRPKQATNLANKMVTPPCPIACHVALINPPQWAQLMRRLLWLVEVKIEKRKIILNLNQKRKLVRRFSQCSVRYGFAYSDE